MNAPPRRAQVALVARSDPLTPHLHAALAARYPIAADVDVELHGWRRAAVAAATLRPTWRQWADSYMKSNLGFRARSRLAQRALQASSYDVAIQTHALFASRSDRVMIYIDCTYRQAMAGWPAWTPHGVRARRRWLAGETAAYRRALHLFVFTAATRRSLVEDYGIAAGRITVVGAGVNFRDPPEVSVRGEVADPVVLFVGKDFDRKGGAVLLDAFALVRRAVPHARLQIVGTALPGAVPEGVEVLGLVRDRAEIAALYARASVFCLPSLFDPGPLVVLEAMAHGLPCVLSQDASHHVRDIIRTAGYVAPTGDARGLADGMIAFLQDGARARAAGECARAAVSHGFRWSDVVERMAPAIDAAVGGSA